MLGTLISPFSIHSWNESKHWASSLKLFTGLTWDLTRYIPDGDACFSEYAFLPWWRVAAHQHVLWNLPCTLTIASEIAKSLPNLQKSLDSLAKVVLDNQLALDYLLAEQGGICAVANSSCYTYVNLSPGRNQHWKYSTTNHLLQQTINHQSLLSNMGGETENWFSSLFSWSKRRRFPFSHYPLIFSNILIYVFYLVLCCLPYCCKPITKTFMLKKEAWDQQV